MLRVILAIAAAAFIISLALAFLPALIPIPILVLVIRARQHWKLADALNQAKEMHWRAWRALGVLLAFSTVIGYTAFGAVGQLLKIAEGTEMAMPSIYFLMCAITCGGASWFFYEVVKGESVKNDIFSVLSDGSKFDSFADGDQAGTALVEINAEALIPLIRQDVIGQDLIVDEVANTLARRARLARKAKPLAVFMFVGSTGSGKTELAKAIGKYAFEGRLCRFDMNEFTESHSTQRLIGSPPGYMGSDQGGQLTREIQRMRSGVILFDEIEKAHPDVYKLLMGLMDEGRITEQSTGKTMDASKFCIVLTSNAEHEKLSALAKTIADPDDRRRAVKDSLLAVFKPEQLARIDEIFCFGPLDRRSMAQIIGKFLFSFAEDCGVQLAKVDSDLLIETIIRHEKQSDYGIRELVRLVEKQVLDGMLMAKDEGFSQVAISAGGGKVLVSGVGTKGATR